MKDYELKVTIPQLSPCNSQILRFEDSQILQNLTPISITSSICSLLPFQE
jgi:hypothetical protein